MDEKGQSVNTNFKMINPAEYKNLTPLSEYSRMVTSDHKPSLHPLGKLSNFKIEVVNNCAKKRKLVHLSLSDGYATPAKKPSSPKALSPDLGCFMDYCSPPAKNDSASPFAVSKSALLGMANAIKSEQNELTSSQPHPTGHVGCGSLTGSGGGKETEPLRLKSENALLNLEPAFDCDVDDILCLNPVATAEENAENCKNLSGNTFQNKPELVPTVAFRQELETGDGMVDEAQEEMKRKMCLNVKGDDDKGYFSMSYVKDLKIGKTPLQPGDPQAPAANSSPLLRKGDVQCQPDGSAERPALSGQHVSFTVSDLCPTANAPLLEFLEGDVEEVWNIGPPIFESSLCHSVLVDTGSEESRHVSEEVQMGMVDSHHEYQTKYTGEETTLDTSYETTLPLQVQVKSVVVLSQQATGSKPVAPSLSEKNAKSAEPSPNQNESSRSDRCGPSARSQRQCYAFTSRPVVFDKAVDWEREKRMYVHSVTRHLNENPGAGQDVMTELLNLMNHVADQKPVSNDKQWQHPSDFTRRNYQRRFGNMTPKMTLHEWQAKSCTTHKRFAKVPKLFERNPLP